MARYMLGFPPASRRTPEKRLGDVLSESAEDRVGDPVAGRDAEFPGGACDHLKHRAHGAAGWNERSENGTVFSAIRRIARRR